MKIGLVIPGGFDRSGRERIIPVFLGLAERLARRHEVHVFTLYQYPHPDEYPLLGANIHNIGYAHRPKANAGTLAHALSAIRREHGRGQFDALHGIWANESGFIAALAGRLWRIRSIVTVAGGELASLPAIDYGGQLRLKRRWLVTLTLRLAGTVTSAAEFTRRILLQRRPDAHLIVLGTDCKLFAPPAGPLQELPWRLIHVASLNRVKDQPTLLRAFREIRDAAPTARLDVIGEDTLNGEIQRLTRDLDLDQAVTFHGFQPSEVVAKMLRRSHLLLHSSLFEDAGPLVFLEAAACAVPTVGTSVGLIDDLAPEMAAAVPVGDHVSMAQVALGLLRDSCRRQELGLRAMAFARLHDADWTANRFESLYTGSAQP